MSAQVVVVPPFGAPVRTDRDAPWARGNRTLTDPAIDLRKLGVCILVPGLRGIPACWDAFLT